VAIFKDRVRTVEEAFAYLTDCTLATVESMALRRSRPKGEYQRQISIAQAAVDWMVLQGYPSFDTRAKEVIGCYDGSVADWAAQYETPARAEAQ
jgi:hypothetical protein